MATYDLEEQERLDALKDWWRQNGKLVYAGVAAFAIVFAGVKGWQTYQAKRADEMAEAFIQFEKTAEAKDAKKTNEAAQKIVEQFPDSAFAAQAALAAARQSFDANDLESAKTRLQWVIAKSKSQQFQSIARLRLASLFLDQKKYDDALKLLDDNKDPAFFALTSDLKGDIYAAQGKVAEARASYKSAIEKTEVNSPVKQLIQIKLDSLGEGK